MKRIVVGFGVMLALSFVVANAADWQAYEGNWSGGFDDSNHWANGLPGTDGDALFGMMDPNLFAHVDFSSGTNECNAALHFRSGWSIPSVLELDGADTTYVMGAGSTVDAFKTYRVNSTELIQIKASNTGAVRARLENFRINCTNALDRHCVDFNGGTYNFYDPTETLQTGGMNLFYGDHYHASLGNGTCPIREVVFRNGADFRLGGNVDFSYYSAHAPFTNRWVVDHGSVYVSGNVRMTSSFNDARQRGNRAELIVDNGSTFEFGYLSLGNSNISQETPDATYVVTFDHGSTGTEDNNDFHTYGGHSIINVRNGSTLKLKRTLAFSAYGHAETEVNLFNATNDFGGFMYLGPQAANSSWYNTAVAHLNLVNSTVTMTSPIYVSSGSIDLVDSTLSGRRKLYRTGVGEAIGTFHANGGVIDHNGYVDAADRYVIADFDSATIGPRGLLIDAAHELFVSQDFADDGAAGVLVLKSTGNMTLSATNTTVSRTVIAAANTVTFSSGANYATALMITNVNTVSSFPAGLKGLVVGNDARKVSVTLDLEKTIDVEGELDLANVAFSATANPSAGVEYTVFVADSVAAGTVTSWEDLTAFFDVPDGYRALFDVAEVDGRYAFKLTVATAKTVELTLASGTETVTTNTPVTKIDTVRTTVGAGAEQTFEGSVGLGRFEKYGTGRAVLANPGNRFNLGFGIYEGVLAATSASALGCTGNGAANDLVGGVLELDFDPSDNAFTGPLTLATSAADGLFILDAKRDAEIAPWANATDKGCFMKTGAGTLTLKATANRQLTGNKGKVGNVRDSSYASASPLVFNADGTLQSGTYLGGNIVEGELRVEGARNVTVSAPYSVGIGAPTLDTQADRPAGFVVDGVTFDHRNQWGVDRLPIASGLKPGVNCGETQGNAYLVVTNGATFYADNIWVANDVKVTKGGPYHLNPRIEVRDGSVLQLKTLRLNQMGDCSNVVSRLAVGGNSKLYVTANNDYDNGFLLRGCAEIEFDSSEFAKNDAHEATGMYFINEIKDNFVHFRFVNGSVFRLNAFGSQGPWSASRRNTFYFDDSEWNPGRDDFTFACHNDAYFTVEVAGRGLILDTPENGTWQWRMDTFGTGGIVKRGAGTLALNATNVTYSGTTEIAAGTLDFENSSLTNAVFSGSGTLVNAALVTPTLKVAVADDLSTSSCLTFGTGVSLSGRVTVDLGRTEPGLVFDKTVSFRVLAYTGAAPDVSRWKLVGTGLENARGVFTAADGFVTCRLSNPPGFIFILR